MTLYTFKQLFLMVIVEITQERKRETERLKRESTLNEKLSK